MCNNTIGSYECVCLPGYIRCSSECIRKLSGSIMIALYFTCYLTRKNSDTKVIATNLIFHHIQCFDTHVEFIFYSLLIF